MNCSNESVLKLNDAETNNYFHQIFLNDETNCDMEDSFLQIKQQKNFPKDDEVSELKEASSETDLPISPSNSTERSQKPFEEELFKKGSPMLTCEICLQLFTEDSDLSKHLLGHISSTSFYQTYDFDTGIRKRSESSTKEKNPVISSAIKNKELETDEEEGENEESGFSFIEEKPSSVSLIEAQTFNSEGYDASNIVSISSSKPTSPSLSSTLDVTVSLSTPHRVKQITSPTAAQESNQKIKIKINTKKNKANTSSTSTVEKELKCDICQRAFSWSSALTRHLRIHSGEKPFSCEICQKSFFQSSDLTQHLRVHTGERPFKCSLCTAAFSQLSALSRHLRCHFGEKPYVCSVCQRAFSQSSALTRHMCSHSEEKLYCCEICGKSFSWSEPLLRHVRTHTGEKPYKCEICAKSFSQTANLSTHMRVHSGEKPFKCPLCDRAFPVSSNLTRHMKTHKDNTNESSDPMTTPIVSMFESLTEPTI